MRHPIAFTTKGVAPDAVAPAPDRVLRGDPHEEEFCVLLQGRMTLTAGDGAAQEFRAGDACVVPGGFSGIWENHPRVRKHYAIMAPEKS